MMNSKATDRNTRTDALLNRVRGKDNEYSILWAFLTAGFDWDRGSDGIHSMGQIYDTQRLAERMDTIATGWKPLASA